MSRLMCVISQTLLKNAYFWDMSKTRLKYNSVSHGIYIAIKYTHSPKVQVNLTSLINYL